MLHQKLFSKQLLKNHPSHRGCLLSLVTAFVLVFFLAPPMGWASQEVNDKEIKALYHSGRYKGLISSLRGNPEESSSLQSLYLGLSHLRLGESLQAIQAWQSYVRLEKGSEGARKITRYLTLLLQKEAKRVAQDQIKREKNLSERVDPKAIAVYPFLNKGSISYAPLSKGLAAMIITDLSKIKGFTVVERIQIQAILNELSLTRSGIVDAKNAPRIGRLVGAAKITTGSLVDVDHETMRLNALVTKTEDAKELSVAEASGALSHFYTLEKTLVFKLLCGMGYCPENLDSQTRTEVEKIHTKNLKAFQHFSEGLTHFDQGDYREASREFILALEEDPHFELARTALLETPLLSQSIDEIISAAEMMAHGPDYAFGIRPMTPGLPVFQISASVIKPNISQPPISAPAAGGTTTVPVTINIDLPE